MEMNFVYTRALRGATTVDKNDKEEIFSAAAEMFEEIIKRNELNPEDIASIIFSLTPDLDKAFPAAAIRRLGITDVPLLDVAQPDIDGALKKCIRVLVHINTDKKNNELHHVYLRGAVVLRPDLINK